jgi:hypothetical protein
MTPKLTDGQRLALESRPSQPVEIEDDRTQRVEMLVARDDLQSLRDERLRHELAVGFEQADRNDAADWDLDEMLIAARGRYDSRTAH